MIDSSRITPDQVASHYDDLDAFYRSIWGNHVHHGLFFTRWESVAEATRALVDLMVQRLGPIEGAEVIDVGSGYGETARDLARRRGARVTALTISARQHDFARSVERGRSNPIYLQRDWMKNQLPDRSADVVYSIESSEHMPDFDRFFSEAARVLRPGGRLAICAWLEGNHDGGWKKKRLLQALCDEGRMRLATRAEYEARLVEHGLDLLSYEDLSDRVSRTWTICLRRAAARLFTDASFRRYLFSSTSANREFAKTLLRIRVAFATGAMRYGLFVATKSRQTDR